MQKTIISDTSCLILLHKIRELELLQKLFQNVFITPEIVSEYDLPLPNWVIIESPTNKTYQRILEASLDKGESSAIALSLEKTDPLLIIDDLKGRKFAEIEIDSMRDTEVSLQSMRRFHVAFKNQNIFT